MNRRRPATPTYGLLRVLMASPDAPMPEAKRRHQLTRMWSGLAALERSPAPTLDDWRVLTPLAVRTGLLDDAVAALAMAGRRHRRGASLRLDAAGIQVVRSILEDYAALLEQLPERTVIEAHRLTEQRIRDILAGRRQPHDIEVMDL